MFFLWASVLFYTKCLIYPDEPRKDDPPARGMQQEEPVRAEYPDGRRTGCPFDGDTSVRMGPTALRRARRLWTGADAPVVLPASPIARQKHANMKAVK